MPLCGGRVAAGVGALGVDAADEWDDGALGEAVDEIAGALAATECRGVGVECAASVVRSALPASVERLVLDGAGAVGA